MGNRQQTIKLTLADIYYISMYKWPKLNVDDNRVSTVRLGRECHDDFFLIHRIHKNFRSTKISPIPDTFVLQKCLVE